MRSSWLFGVVVVAGLLGASAAWADDKDKKDDPKGDDSKFVTEAATGGLCEIKLGQLAVKQASNPDVKKFGQRMIDDHTRVAKDLSGVADKKGIKVSTDLPKKQQEKFDDLAKLKGAEFDRAYMKMMVQDHEEDVKEFDKQAKSGADPDVKAFAAKALPTLREHLTMAKEIYDRVKESK
jgi:putative membrane protein